MCEDPLLSSCCLDLAHKTFLVDFLILLVFNDCTGDRGTDSQVSQWSELRQTCGKTEYWESGQVCSLTAIIYCLHDAKTNHVNGCVYDFFVDYSCWVLLCARLEESLMSNRYLPVSPTNSGHPCLIKILNMNQQTIWSTHGGENQFDNLLIHQ